MRAALLALVLCGCTARPPELPPQPVSIAYPRSSAPAPQARAAPWVHALPPPHPPAGLDVPARDRRLTGHTPSVLAADIANLQTLLRNPSALAPSRAVLLQHLADAYVELRKLGENRSPDVIATLDQLVVAYPQAPRVDEALYELGLEYEVSGDLANAHGAYLDLLRLYPTSTWVPFAHFALGELLLREARTDATKWALALAQYEATIRDGDSAVLPDALWRAGQAADRAGAAGASAAFYAQLRRDYPASAAAARIGEGP